MVLLLVAGCAFAIFRLSLRSKLNARIDAIRAASYPVTCAELDQWYKIPPNVENAAYTIEDAFSFYKTWDKEKSKSLPVVGRAELPARSEPLDEETKALITQYIADNNEALELLHAGAKIKNCRYPIDLSDGLTTQLHHVGEIRNFVRLLKLEAILHAENGEGELAVRSAISSFGIARSLAKEPVIVSQLLHAGCQSLATSTIEYCINRIALADEQLVELIECVHNAERISDMSCAFVGERCMGIGFFKAPELMDPDIFEDIPVRPILELYKAVGMTDADTIIYLDIMDGYIKSAQLPPHQRLEADKAIDTRLQSTSKVHILLHVIMPPLSRITSIELRTIANLRNARTALAIQRFRLATGRLPDALIDLVPAYLDAVPTDPFDGKDLRYEKLGVGFVVYSVGQDLRDDGGTEKPPRRTKESPSWDVTFIVER
jgi:hypothetical protein